MNTLDEIRLSEKEKEILLKIKAAVKTVLPESTVIFFGSRARGDAEADSDWDILVLADKVDWDIEHKVYSAVYKVELSDDIIVNPIIIERADWEYKRYDGHPLKRNVEKEGVLVA